MHRPGWILSLCLVVLAGILSAFARADQKPQRITIATWNLEWFFDDYTGDNYRNLAREQSAPSREAWQWKRDGVAAAIAKIKPTILALQEVESSRVVYYLTKALKDKHGLEYHIAFIQGYDFGTEQDVAVIYRSGLVEYSRREQSREMWSSQDYYSLSKHLFARFEWGHGDEKESLLLLTVHLRAFPDAADIRRRQARLARAWLRAAILRGDNVVALGDFNTNDLYGESTAESDMGILYGAGTADKRDDLIDLHDRLKPDQRATHLIGKQFDRILVSKPLLDDAPDKRDLVFRAIANRKDVCVVGEKADEDHWQIYWSIPQAERDLSDHYPLTAEFEFR
jgi:endonuclease/exonuclease/phosphatase family metal-dependent hydrolase